MNSMRISVVCSSAFPGRGFFQNLFERVSPTSFHLLTVFVAKGTGTVPTRATEVHDVLNNLPLFM